MEHNSFPMEFQLQAYLHFMMCNSPDPTGKKWYMMPDATIIYFPSGQVDKAVWNGWDSALEQMSIGARFSDIEKRR